MMTMTMMMRETVMTMRTAIAASAPREMALVSCVNRTMRSIWIARSVENRCRIEVARQLPKDVRKR